MTELDHLKSLKRKRPKTHWVWYIGSIIASLGIGLSIAYTMQQTKAATNIKSSNPTNVATRNVPKIDKSPITIQYPSTKSTTSNPVVAQIPVAEKKAPVYQALQTPVQSTKQVKEKSDSSTKTSPTKKITSQPVQTKPKSNHSNHSNETPPKTNKPPVQTPEPPKSETPEPKPPTEPRTGPIVKIVNHVAHTVQYLLTGKTKQN